MPAAFNGDAGTEPISAKVVLLRASSREAITSRGGRPTAVATASTPDSQHGVRLVLEQLAVAHHMGEEVRSRLRRYGGTLAQSVDEGDGLDRVSPWRRRAVGFVAGQRRGT